MARTHHYHMCQCGDKRIDHTLIDGEHKGNCRVFHCICDRFSQKKHFAEWYTKKVMHKWDGINYGL